MAKQSGQVKLIHAALDESSLGTMVVRGVLVPETLQYLRVGDYQREQQHVTPRSSLYRAMVAKERFPDLELGMRSENFDAKGTTATLQDDVWIVDGLQRVTTALHYLQKHGADHVHLGAVVHLNTTEEWERQRFRVLNANRSKVSPSVLLRNERVVNHAVKVLYGLATTDKQFVLYEKVQWKQKMARTELISALNWIKATTQLHHHKVAANRTSLSTLLPILEKQVDLVGSQIYRDNIKEFWSVLDDCWGVRLAQYQSAPHLRSTFLRSLSRVFSDHHDFWVAPAENRFFVSVDLRRKIALFEPNDPTVSGLAGAGGKAPHLLYNLMLEHINSGKRTKRLKSRLPVGVGLDDNGDDEADEE